jgi:hypothetical protein
MELNVEESEDHVGLSPPLYDPSRVIKHEPLDIPYEVIVKEEYYEGDNINVEDNDLNDAVTRDCLEFFKSCPKVKVKSDHERRSINYKCQES